MDNFTKMKGYMSVEGGAEQDCRELFKDRSKNVIEAYCKLFTDPGEKTFSHITGSPHPKHLNNYKNFNIHFVETNEVYFSIFESKTYKKGTLTKQLEVPANATHVAYTDIFGRILTIEGVSEDVPDFYSLFYGIDPDLEHNQHLWFQNDHRLLLPLGNLISGRNFLSVDSLGFRLAKTNRTIWNLGRDTEKYHDIAIVGGSFAHSIYSLPGEGFGELLENLLNSSDSPISEKFRVWNLSMPGHVQSDSFSLLMNSSLINHFDTILWIDGVNDLFTTTNFKSIGLPEIPLPLTVKWNGIKFDQQKVRFSTNNSDKVKLFVEYRKYISEIMKKLDVKCINILQPTINMNNLNHKPDTKELFPYFSGLAYGSQKKFYNKAIPLIQQLGSLDDLEFHTYKENSDNPIDFWDFVHLSPRGELQYAEYLKELLIKSLM